MKKTEILNLIIKEEKQLWDDLQKLIDAVGMYDPLVDVATARWFTISNLYLKLTK